MTLLAWKPEGAMSRSAVVTYNSPDVTAETKDFTKPTTNDWGGEKIAFLSLLWVFSGQINQDTQHSLTSLRFLVVVNHLSLGWYTHWFLFCYYLLGDLETNKKPWVKDWKSGLAISVVQRMGYTAWTVFPSPLAEGVQSLVYLLWPLKVLPVGALQLHKNGEKMSVAAFGQRKNCKEMEPPICQRGCQEKCLCSSRRSKKGQ